MNHDVNGKLDAIALYGHFGFAEQPFSIPLYDIFIRE